MRIRFGVAGTAHWARTVHIPGLLAAPGIELVGIWGRTEEKVRGIANDHGIRAFSRYDEMLEAVDAVSIAVPPDKQPALAIQAMHGGKHLLLEKPLATSVKDADTVADSLPSRVAAIVFLMRRFVPAIEQAIEAVSRETWRTAEVRVHSSALAVKGPYSESEWRKAAGAVLWDNGPHVLSILIPALGPVVSVSATHDEAQMTRLVTRHARGAVANTTMTLYASPESAIREYTFIADRQRVTLPEPDFSHQTALRQAAQDLIEMISTRTYSHRCGVKFAVEIVRILEAADLSAARGRAVELQIPT
jgi:predicted dehydrogenase